MEFDWSPSQRELVERVLTFSKTLAGGLDEREREHRFPRQEWERCGEFGLLGLCVPEPHGGLGLDALTSAAAIEAFGRGCEDMGLVFSAAAHLFACAMPLVEHGSDAIKQRLFPRLARGELIGANAITEAEAGSDVFALRARAVRDGDWYVLDGAKSYVTNGPIADVIVVYASTSPKDGYLGVSAFAVEKGTPGLLVGEPFAKVGLRTSPIAALYLERCRVPVANRLGAEGDGARVFSSSMQWERACLFAGYLGAMERQLERSLAYAGERQQFRRPIGKNQAISHRIVDMKLRLEAARLLLYRACWLHAQGREASLEISLAKLAVSEAAIQSGLDLMHIHGGVGYMQETGIDRALRDALPATVFSGTSEIQRDLIAKRLGL